MKKGTIFLNIGLFTALVAITTIPQNNVTFTGTAVSLGSGMNTRTSTRPFTMNIKAITSDLQTAKYLAVLQNGGQDDLLKSMQNEDLGTFILSGRLGDTLTGVRVSDVEGKRRIRAVFERRINIAEIREGYRSADYPFGYVELIVDPVTGKGEGSYMAAAQIRFKKDKKTGQDTVEIEGFATFPSKLMGVQIRGR